MSTKAPSQPIDVPCISEAWVKAVRNLCLTGNQEGTPLSVSFTGFSETGFPIENETVRTRLDSLLDEAGAFSVETTANMIFPLQNLRLMEAREARVVAPSELTSYYIAHVYPKLKARNMNLNGKGTYFLRMVAYGMKDLDSRDGGIDQIDKLVKIWLQNPHIKQSTLQVAIRDPSSDLNHNPRRPFPCLQQVCVGYDKKGMSVTGFYPIQSIFERAYGNYLGLAYLGWFIARAVGRKLVRVTCITPHPQLSGSKGFKKAKMTNEFLTERGCDG